MISFSITAAAENAATVHLIDQVEDLSALGLSAAEARYVQDAAGREQTLIPINRYSEALYVFVIKEKKDSTAAAEGIRKGGAELSAILKAQKTAAIHIFNHTANTHAAYLFAQGAALAAYQFLKYRKEQVKQA